MTNFTIRHYDPDADLSALSRMLTEIESIDRDGEETSEEFLRSMTKWPNFDPDKNVWVAEQNGVLVGYGQILPKSDNICSIYAVVHPGQRRNGLGGQFLELILARARKAQARKAILYINGHNAASLAFLDHHGFDVAGTSGVMVAPVTDLPQAEIPAGFSLRRYPELGDPQILVQALNECYKDQVGHHQNVTSAERYMNYYGEEGIHLLFDDQDRLLGICAAKPSGKTDTDGVSDLLDAPGLVKELRRHGHQRFLALAVMNWLRRQGTRPITLEYWGDDEKAIEIYRGLGFTLTNEQLTYHKELA
ncbi:MAG: GNAT family N-acetyltransferase [Chloroflexota bacterium]